MQDAHFRALDDIGIRVPKSLPLPPDPALVEIIDRLAGLTRGAGIVMAAAEIAADPSPATRLRTILGLLQQLVFGRAQQTLDEALADIPVLGCRSGCAHCCYQSVEATIPEAILAALQLADPADPRRRALLETADAVQGLAESERRRTGRPCSFLVENRCSIYDNRPLMCRAFLAVDAEDCRAANVSAFAGLGETDIRHFPGVQFFLLGDQAGMRGICKDMGLQHDLVELTQAVATILRDPSIVDRWLAGETVFGPETLEAQPPASAAAASP
jgi:Fe-S-cluster containining protein